MDHNKDEEEQKTGEGRASSISFAGQGTRLSEVRADGQQAEVARDIASKSSALRNLQAARRASANTAARNTKPELPSPGSVVIE